MATHNQCQSSDFARAGMEVTLQIAYSDSTSLSSTLSSITIGFLLAAALLPSSTSLTSDSRVFPMAYLGQIKTAATISIVSALQSEISFLHLFTPQAMMFVGIQTIQLPM